MTQMNDGNLFKGTTELRPYAVNKLITRSCAVFRVIGAHLCSSVIKIFPYFPQSRY